MRRSGELCCGKRSESLTLLSATRTTANRSATSRKSPSSPCSCASRWSAASWKPGSRATSAASSAVRIVAGSGPVEVLRSSPISILTVFMIGCVPPNRSEITVAKAAKTMVVHSTPKNFAPENSAL